jgi:hypothetical protein
MHNTIDRVLHRLIFFGMGGICVMMFGRLLLMLIN